MVLTDAGRTFLPYAERALETLRNGAPGGEIGAGTAGELAIGAAPAVSTYVLPPLLDRFVREHPEVRLLVRTGHSEEIVDMVLRSEVQLGLVRELRDGRVVSRPMYADELVLVVCPPSIAVRRPRAGRAARRGAADLLRPDLQLLRPHERDVPRGGRGPRGAIELDNIDAAKKMVQQGLGVALLPNTAVSEDVERGLLRADRDHRRPTDPPPDRVDLAPAVRAFGGPLVRVLPAPRTDPGARAGGAARPPEARSRPGQHRLDRSRRIP